MAEKEHPYAFRGMDIMFDIALLVLPGMLNVILSQLIRFILIPLG